MKEERLMELLAYAKVCFEKCTSPFESLHLIKKNITLNECEELRDYIASIINNYLDLVCGYFKAEHFIKSAEKEFEETQNE